MSISTTWPLTWRVTRPEYYKRPVKLFKEHLRGRKQKKFDFLFAGIFNDLMSMKMAALPCAAGSSDLNRASLKINYSGT